MLTKSKVKTEFPNAKSLHNNYGTIMHEAQMNDSRMNINALLTASVDKFHPGMKGATLANYMEFKDFVKDDQGKITGAVLQDKLDGKEFKVKAKVVVNCSGIFADSLRLKDDANVPSRI